MTASTKRPSSWAEIVGLIHRAPKAHVLAIELSAVALLATTAAVIIAVRVIRHCKTTAALQDRGAFDLLPTNSFDPTPEDIHRFARLVQRTRLAAPGSTPRRAAAVRIRLHTVEHGRLAYRVEGSRRAAAVLGQQTFAGVELRAVIDRQSDDAEAPASPGTRQAGPGERAMEDRR
ncbi:hypothetical protein KDK95_20775 [Actinospica sp. MGRD01-02]|uniref:Uncharacterized protein n=1 Tax=Actinospica acidithermotolerans TaxID=2828514 RepID=A0A941E9I7_9ACTN|nr:hypothetical protein [Actinospica acidithermotolerans]MBR7828755.1 hypothetical protein [Actinospica acidithermotolerans]